MSDDAIRVSGPINAAGLEMTLETGKLAQLADGAVVVKVGGTTLLSTVATSKPREGIDFFPLTVDVEERMYAAGKIPGSFFRREGRPGEQAILTCRLTDRPLRPSFPADFRNEVQVIATILGVDLENPHDIASINGASAALTVSGIPFNGPIGAVRLAHHDGEWIAHPTFQEGDESTFEIVVAGRRARQRRRRDHDGRGRRHRSVVGALRGGRAEGHRGDDRRGPRRVEAVDQGVDRAADPAARGVREGPRPDRADRVPARRSTTRPRCTRRSSATPRPTTAAAMAIADKNDRNARLDEIERRHAGRTLVGTVDAPGALAERATEVKRAFRSLQKEVTRSRIVNEGVRIDGRGPADIRPLSAEVGVVADRARHRPVPAGRDAGALGRDARHAAHGADARHDHARRQEALHAPLQLPAVLDRRDRSGRFAEAARDRSRCARRAGARPGAADVASSGRTRCASSPTCSRRTAPRRWRRCAARRLSLMDAGVPIKAPVAGIAMGLVFAEGKYTTLTDILGAEDAFGDMDFKVAGTVRVRHRAAARHEDRGHPGRRARAGAAPGEGSPRSKILDGDARARSPRRATRCATPHRRS